MIFSTILSLKNDQSTSLPDALCNWNNPADASVRRSYTKSLIYFMVASCIYYLLFAIDLLLIGYLLIKFSNPLPSFTDLETGKSETIVMFIKKRHLKYALDRDLYRSQSWDAVTASEADGNLLNTKE